MKYFTTITEKGQITLPAAIRQRWQVSAGQKIQVSLRPNGDVMVEPLVNADTLRQETQRYLTGQGYTPNMLREMAESYQNGRGISTHLEKKYGKKR